jgi:hypothetical protein
VTQIEQLLRHQALDSAVRRIAPGLQADPDKVMDSRAFHRATDGLDPASASYDTVIRAAIGSVAPASAPASAPAALARPVPVPAAPAAGTPDQWTDADVSRSSPAELAAAVEAGQLTSLGWPPRRQRTRG